MLVLFILAALAYGAASVSYGIWASKPDSQIPRLALGAAAALHVATIGSQCTEGLHPFKSIYLALSLGLMTTVVGYLLLSSAKRPMRSFGAVLAPLGLVGLTLGVVMGPGAPDAAAPSPGLLSLHIAAATLGIAGFSLAAGVAGLYLGMERRLRTKVFRPGQPGMSLTGLDRLHFWLVLSVTPIFTVAIVSGALVLLEAGGSSMLSSRGLELSAALVAWLASVAVLVARAGWGLRGRRAAWLTLLAFVSMLLIVVSYGVRG